MASTTVKSIVIDALGKFKGRQDTFNSETYVAKVAGKDLMLNTDKTKLDTIAQGAQVNTLEGLTIDGVAQTINTETKVATLDLSAYAKKSDVSAALNYKGTVASFSNLPITGNTTGDVYNVTAAGGTDVSGVAVKAGDNVAYNGTGWDVLGGTTDLSAYSTTAQVEGMFDTALEGITDNEIAALFTNNSSGE